MSPLDLDNIEFPTKSSKLKAKIKIAKVDGEKEDKEDTKIKFKANFWQYISEIKSKYSQID